MICSLLARSTVLHLQLQGSEMHVRQMNEVSVTELDKYIIIDTHGGEEDILGIVAAIQLAKKYHKIILGITCVAGRRSVEQAVDDALIAQQITKSSIPVFKGSKQSLLLRKQYPACHNFIDNSISLDAFVVEDHYKKLVQEQSASVFMAEQIRKHSEELCIITFGPLTNLAIAFHQTQTLKVLSSIRVNGGALTAVGNVINSSGSEGNMAFDPQAGHIVISNYNNVYFNPIENTLSTDWKPFLTTLRQKHEENSHLSRILDLLINREFSLCGPLLTLLPAFSKQTVTKVVKVYSEIITSGRNIVGMTASNWLRLQVGEHQQTPNTKIYSQIDLTQSQRIIEQSLDLK